MILAQKPLSLAPANHLIRNGSKLATGVVQKQMFLDRLFTFSLFLRGCRTLHFCPLALSQRVGGPEGFDDYILSDQLAQYSRHFGHRAKRVDGGGLKCLHEQLLSGV
jgi:hypothetical protein